MKTSYKAIVKLIQEVKKSTAGNSLRKKVDEHEKKLRLIESRMTDHSTARKGLNSCVVNTVKTSGFKSIHSRETGKLGKLLQQLDLRQATLKEQIKLLETETNSTKETEISERHCKRKFK